MNTTTVVALDAFRAELLDACSKELERPLTVDEAKQVIRVAATCEQVLTTMHATRIDSHDVVEHEGLPCLLLQFTTSEGAHHALVPFVDPRTIN
ncbi:hypothetical protein [Paraburkholderia atlantica]|uniref:hypothetical protein n=1 Tax=Paraburkholderia atlantica TaxID=2654982 RepID=UPI003D1926F2